VSHRKRLDYRSVIQAARDSIAAADPTLTPEQIAFRILHNYETRPGERETYPDRRRFRLLVSRVCGFGCFEQAALSAAAAPAGGAR